MDLDGRWFVDPKTKRTVLFKGINVGAGTKLPVGLTSHDRNGYWVDNDRYVSFIGRPFPLNEADDHLQRLINYGFNLFRFIVTWEAIEHKGPGQYDMEYLDYVVELLKKCKSYDIKVFIDPHQDCWSRHCGGSGHPGWTLLLAGLNPLRFPDTEAALVHNLYPEPKNFPKMIWNTNYQKLAAATMFTLFFAGRDYAPNCIVNGIHVQDYLQQHYFKSIEQLVIKIHANGLENDVVIGYDTINEPGQGYLPFKHLDKLLEEDTDFKMGNMPTPFQGMLLGSGIPTKVQHYEFKWNGPKKSGNILIDPQNKSAWLTEVELKEACDLFNWERDTKWPAGCIWETHGVWTRESQKLLIPDYFSSNPATGEPTNYINHWLEHVQHYVTMIRKIHTDAILFVQSPVLEIPPKLPANLDRLVYAPHWYDGLTLVKKKWCNYNVDFINLQRGKYGTGPLRFLRAFRYGEKAIRQCFVDQLKTIQSEGYENIGAYPCLMGEIGIPYDMVNDDEKSSLTVWWSWFTSFFVQSKQTSKTNNIIQTPESSQNKALDANFNALEKNLLNYTLWQYMPDNSSDWGDLWNGEDLSIWQQLSSKTTPYLNIEKASTISSISTSSETGATLINTTTTSTTTIADTDKSKKLSTNNQIADVYIARTSNSSTGSFQQLLQHQSLNERDLICLYRPHPHITSGTPVDINFISPTDKLAAEFKYTIDYKAICDGPTEIHVPNRFFPDENTKITTSVGEWSIKTTSQNYWILQWIINEAEDIDKVEVKLEGTTV